MISFNSELWIWKGEGAARWYFLTVPEAQSAEIKLHSLGSPRGFGSVKVAASIGETSWRTSIFPMKTGGYLLPVKADVRRRAGIAAGDHVTVELELV